MYANNPVNINLSTTNIYCIALPTIRLFNLQTEAAYMKILESSQTLLHVLKRETVNLTKKKQSSS